MKAHHVIALGGMLAAAVTPAAGQAEDAYAEPAQRYEVGKLLSRLSNAPLLSMSGERIGTIIAGRVAPEGPVTGVLADIGPALGEGKHLVMIEGDRIREMRDGSFRTDPALTVADLRAMPEWDGENERAALSR